MAVPSLDSVLSKFRKPNADWEDRVAALQDAASIARSFPHTCFQSHDVTDLLAEVRELGPYLVDCVEDLRSTLVKEAAEAIQVLAECWGLSFVHAVGNDVLPALLKRSANKTAVIRESAVNAAKTMFDNGVEALSFKTAQLISNTILDRKLARTMRAAAAEFVGMMFVENCIEGLHTISDTISAAIIGGCQDPDEEVRKISRQNLRTLQKLSPLDAVPILDKLPFNVQALIQRESQSSPLDITYASHTTPNPLSRNRQSLAQRVPINSSWGESSSAAMPPVRKINKSPASPKSSSSGSSRVPHRLLAAASVTKSRTNGDVSDSKPLRPAVSTLPPRINVRLPTTTDAHSLLNPRTKKRNVPVLKRGPRRSMAPNAVINLPKAFSPVASSSGSSSSATEALPKTVQDFKSPSHSQNSNLSSNSVSMSAETSTALQASPHTPSSIGSSSPKLNPDVSPAMNVAKVSPHSQSVDTQSDTNSEEHSTSLGAETSPAPTKNAMEASSPDADPHSSSESQNSTPTQAKDNSPNDHVLTTMSSDLAREVQSTVDSRASSAKPTEQNSTVSDAINLPMTPESDSQSSVEGQESSLAESSSVTEENSDDSKEPSAIALVASAIPASPSEGTAISHIGIDQNEENFESPTREYSKVTIADAIIPKTPEEKQSYLEKLRLSFIMGTNITPAPNRRQAVATSNVSLPEVEDEDSDVREKPAAQEKVVPRAQGRRSSTGSSGISISALLRGLGLETEHSTDNDVDTGSVMEAPKDANEKEESASTVDKAALLKSICSLADASDLPVPEVPNPEGQLDIETFDTLVKAVECRVPNVARESEHVAGDNEKNSATESRSMKRSTSGLRSKTMGKKANEQENGKEITKENERPRGNPGGRKVISSTKATSGKPPLKGGSSKTGAQIGSGVRLKGSSGISRARSSGEISKRTVVGSNGHRTVSREQSSGNTTRQARRVRSSIVSGPANGRASTTKGSECAQEKGGTTSEARAQLIKRLHSANGARQKGWQDRAKSLEEFGEACKNLRGGKIGNHLAEDCVGMLGLYAQDGHYRVVTGALDGLFFLLLCADGESSSDALRRAMERNEGTLGRVLALVKDGRENVRLAAARVLQSFEVAFRPETRANLVLRAMCGGRCARGARGVSDARVLEMGCVQLVSALEGAQVSGEGFVWKGSLLEGVLAGMSRIAKDRRVEVRRAAGAVLKAVRVSLPEGALEMACDKFGVSLSIGL